MPNRKIVYRTFSPLQTFISTLWIFALILIATIALYNFQENPVVTSVIAAICLLILLLSGDDEIIVYSDGFKYTSWSPLKQWRKKRFYSFREIRKIEISGEWGLFDELNSNSTRPVMPNKLQILMKNGSSDNFTSTIYILKLKEAARQINARVN